MKPIGGTLFYQKSLLLRLVSSFFLLSSLIVALLTAFSYLFLARNARQQILDKIEAIASSKVDTLNEWVEKQVREVSSIAQLPALRSAAVALCVGSRTDAERDREYQLLERSFKTILAHASEFRGASILSGEGGRIVFSTDSQSEGQYRTLENAFSEGMKRTSIQSVHLSPITLEPTMSISTPVRNVSGIPAGVLVVDLNLDSMDRIIEDRTGLGRTGEAYLVDRFNTFVSGVRFGRADYPRGVHSEGIEAALRGENGSGSYRNYAAVPVIAAYRWISEWDLALLVEVRQDEAFRPAWMQTLVLVGIGFSLVLALAFGVYLLARRLAEPVLAIQQAAVRVTDGDLDATAPVLTHDEVGSLAESFNRMTATVKGLYEELRRREEHFRALIESSMDIVVVLGADCTVSFASPSVKRVLGYETEELRRTPILSLVHPEDIERYRSEYDRLRRGGDEAILGLPLRLKHKDGTWRTLAVNARNLLDHPAIGGFVVNGRDETERQLLEDRLRQAQKMEAVGRLAGGVAHDFNNLLTVITGYANTLSATESLAPEARNFVDEIENAASRAAGLTQQLLAYSRKQVLQPRTIDLNALLSGMDRMLRSLIGEDVEILIHQAKDLKSVRADPNQIAQVIMNLAANARDAMPNGGTMVFETQNAVLDAEYCRRFSEISPGEYAVLVVSDTGYGMDRETQSRIFEPFFTTKGIGKGIGLGLATVYGIVRQSGGHINVYSEVGRGSTFKVYLPVVAAEASLQPGNVAEGAIPASAAVILVVEDEPPLRRMVCMVLERAGYSVCSAAGSDEAFSKAAGLERLDLIVTDVILPGKNGKEIVDAIRHKHPSLKVLFISGYTESIIDRHGVLLPEMAFLQKPFSASTLAKKVREVLDAR